jgi:hypothetical protein
VKVAYAWIAGAVLLYGAALVPANAPEYPALWWSLFALWAVACLATAWISGDGLRWVLSWLLTLLVFPKRDPNGDFVTALNSTTHASVPVVEALLAVFAVAALVATWRRRTQDTVDSPVRAPIALMGYGLIVAAVIGTVMSFVNLQIVSDYFPPYFVRSLGRAVRELSEGCAIVALMRVEWTRESRRDLWLVVRFALAVAIVEFLSWAFPVLPEGLRRYLSDFRGGFRSVVHGYAAGLMMSQAWIFLIAMTYLFGESLLLLASAAVSMAAAFISYQRTVFGAVAMVAVILTIQRMARRASMRLALAAALVFIAAVPARPAIQRLTEQASEAKGGEYLNTSSLKDRYDLALLSFNALKNSVVFGIGPAALPAYTFRVLVNGGVLGGNFAYSVNNEFDTDVGSRQFDSHNLWVSLTVESGVVGVAVMIGYFWLGVRLLTAWRRHHKQAFMVLIVWAATFASYVSQAEPYILSLTCMVAWIAIGQMPQSAE